MPHRTIDSVSTRAELVCRVLTIAYGFDAFTGVKDRVSMLQSTLDSRKRGAALFFWPSKGYMEKSHKHCLNHLFGLGDATPNHYPDYKHA